MRVKWTAILVAAVADWVLGAVWFYAFAKQWSAGLRAASEPIPAGMTHPNFWPFLIALVSSIVMAYVIARVVAGSQTRGLFRGIIAGILVGLAAAMAMVTEMVFEIHPGSFVLIAAGYPLVGCILMGITIGAWRVKAAPVVTRPAPTKP